MPDTLGNLGRLPPPGFLAKENYWPFTVGRPSFMDEGNSVPLFFEKHNLIRDAGPDLGLTNPPSQNVEDRRNDPPFNPGLMDTLRSLTAGFVAYPGRKYGPYDADIDASLARTNEAYAITPALETLGSRENWYKEIDRQLATDAGGPTPPKKIMREYARHAR